LNAGETLSAGQGLVSPNGRYSIAVQGDGNVVDYRSDGKGIWQTKTASTPEPVAVSLSNQADGNLVLYLDGVPVWASGTFNRGWSAVLTDFGELLMVAPSPAWKSIWGPDPDPMPGPTPPPASGVSGAKGQTRLFGSRCMGDDEGPKLYVGLSRFAWLWFWKHDRDRVLRELDADRAAGYRFGRVLAQVGDPKEPKDFWAGRIVDPDWPDYEELIHGLNGAAKERGHLIEWTIIGKGGPYDRNQTGRVRLVSRVAGVLAREPGAVLFGEIMNEPNVITTITGDELKALASVAKSMAPMIPWATGAFWFAPEDGKETDPQRYDRALKRTQSADLDIEHLDRDMSRGEGQDRPWRQGWDHALTGRRWDDNEAVGVGSSVTSENRPNVLRSHRAVNFVCRAFASTLHGKPGVRGDLKWEDEPAYLQVPKAIRLLPGNLAEGQPLNSNGNFPSRPFTLDNAFLRAETANRIGIVRCYSIVLNGVYYSIPFGAVSPFELKAERNLRTQCFQQDSGDLLWERDVAAGERVTFDGKAPDYLLISRSR